MDEKIEVSLSRIKEIVDSFDGKTFTTVEVLHQYSGGFHSNIDTPAFYSFNAQFGKLLKRNESSLNIIEEKSGVSIKDDNGHRTTTSNWKSRT